MAREAARCGLEVSCARFHGGDCTSSCASPFAVCGTSFDDCVRHFVTEYTEDIDTPFVNEALAAACTDQLAAASCLDPKPDTVACDFALVEGCADDDDGYGANFGPTTPYELGALPATITPTLCRSVREWYAVDVPPGTTKLRVTVAAATDRNAVEVRTYRPVALDRRLPDSELVFVRPGSSEVVSVPGTGRVLVSVEVALSRERRTITFSAE